MDSEPYVFCVKTLYLDVASSYYDISCSMDNGNLHIAYECVGVIEINYACGSYDRMFLSANGKLIAVSLKATPQGCTPVGLGLNTARAPTLAVIYNEAVVGYTQQSVFVS